MEQRVFMKWIIGIAHETPADDLNSLPSMAKTPTFSLTVVSRSGRNLGEFNLPTDRPLTVDVLQAEFHRKYRQWYPDRQWFTKQGEKARLEPGKMLEKDCGVKTGDTVVFKDLGPQVRAVAD